jgi:hypothetical protein
MNTGSVREGFPAAGAWAGYALGSLNDNLPTFVAITDVRGEPPNGKANWASGFLPAQHQAVMLAAHQPLRNLSRPDGISAAEDLATESFLQRLNQENGAPPPGESDLTARTASYEMAARMQLAAPEVADLSRESAATHPSFMARTIQIRSRPPTPATASSRAGFSKRASATSASTAPPAPSGVDGLLNWDAHRTLKTDYERHCPIFDQPTAALLTDLQRARNAQGYTCPLGD